MILKRIGGFLVDLLEVFVFAVAIFLFIYLLVMQPHKIKGDSMQPNYPDGQYLLTDKITYRFNKPKRGDVIVFEAPGTNGDEYIKRIIGLPGEKLRIFEGKVFINGNVLVENYLSPTLYTTGGIFLGENIDIQIPEGRYFVMGDNRIASSDSRTFGYLAYEKIRGRAFFIYWPLDKLGATQKVNY